MSVSVTTIYPNRLLLDVTKTFKSSHLTILKSSKHLKLQVSYYTIYYVPANSVYSEKVVLLFDRVNVGVD